MEYVCKYLNWKSNVLNFPNARYGRIAKSTLFVKLANFWELNKQKKQKNKTMYTRIQIALRLILMKFNSETRNGLHNKIE